MRDRLFKTYSNRKGTVVLLRSIHLINIESAIPVYTKLGHRREEGSRREVRHDGKRENFRSQMY